MIRRPPRSTRTDTLFPYTTLFRSKPWPAGLKGSELYVFADGGEVWTASRFFGLLPRQNYELASAGGGVRLNFKGKTLVGLEAARTLTLPYAGTTRDRSEERRVGKECVSTCRSRWWPDH